jgi:hypothetical protein
MLREIVVELRMEVAKKNNNS